MKHTAKQIEDKVIEIFDLHDQQKRDRSFKVRVDIGKQEINIDISKMYDYINLSFQHLVKLSKFLGCKEISDTRSHSDGCETCDYGSTYTVELHCWNFKEAKTRKA